MEQRFPPSFGDDYVPYRRKIAERIGDYLEVLA